MDYSQLIIACCIFFLDLIRLSQTASCDVIKIYADIQRCKTEHNVTSTGQEPDMSDINEFCRSLEASRLCTKMAVDSCDDENVKASMSPQIQQYDTLKQSSYRTFYVSTDKDVYPPFYYKQ